MKTGSFSSMSNIHPKRSRQKRRKEKKSGILSARWGNEGKEREKANESMFVRSSPNLPADPAPDTNLTTCVARAKKQYSESSAGKIRLATPKRNARRQVRYPVERVVTEDNTLFFFENFGTMLCCRSGILKQK